jgi:hypothetical protein
MRGFSRLCLVLQLADRTVSEARDQPAGVSVAQVMHAKAERPPALCLQGAGCHKVLRHIGIPRAGWRGNESPEGVLLCCRASTTMRSSVTATVGLIVV